MNYSNIMSENYCKKSGLRQLVPEAYSPKILPYGKLLPKTWLAGRLPWPRNSGCKFRLVYSILKQKTPSWSLADTERVSNQLGREIYGIFSNQQKWFRKEFSIWLIQFEDWWETIGIQALQETIEQCVIHFANPIMQLVSHISQSIQRMGSGDEFTIDSSELLHIANVKDAYWSSNKVNFIQQMLKHNDQCTSHGYMEKTLSYLALQGWYDVDSAKVFNQLTTFNKQRSTCRAHL